jgi:3-oxoadipate enol-lactonase
MLDGVTKHWVDGHPKLCFEEFGEGPPVVFLHGIGGNKGNWRKQQEAISEFATGIAWDARGYGDSDDYDGELQFSDFSNDLLRLIDARGIEKAHFVGLSMGARILLDFWTVAPSRISTLTLADFFYSFDKSLTPEKQEEFISMRRKPLLEGMSLFELGSNLIPTLVSQDCSRKVKEEILSSILELHRESYLKTITATTFFDASGVLPDICVPVQLIYGADDQLTLPSIGAEAQGLIPNANLDVIDRAGHLTNIERPEEFNRVMCSFLKQHLSGASFISTDSDV